jgi:hypothetical protein
MKTETWYEANKGFMNCIKAVQVERETAQKILVNTSPGCSRWANKDSEWTSYRATFEAAKALLVRHAEDYVDDCAKTLRRAEERLVNAKLLDSAKRDPS